MEYFRKRNSVNSRPPSSKLRECAAIEVNGLTKKFRQRVVVDGATFIAPAGAITCIVGRNGSGKSTTLKMLVGLIRPTTGSATIGGVRYDSFKDPTREVGVVLCNSNFVGSLSVGRHLKQIAISSNARPERVLELSIELGIDQYMNHKIDSLSTGVRRRFEFACALANDPRVLLLDEPTSGLDAAGLDWFYEFISRSLDQKITILMVTHRADEVKNFSCRTITIANGTITGIEDTK